MFGLGFGELLLILFLIFIFVGPESFIKVSKYITKLLRHIKDIREDVENSIYYNLNEDVYLKNKLESSIMPEVKEEDL